MTADELFGETSKAMYFRIAMAMKQARYAKDGWNVFIDQSKRFVQIETPENISGSFEYGHYEVMKKDEFDCLRTSYALMNSEDANMDLLKRLDKFDGDFMFARDFRAPFKRMAREKTKEVCEQIRNAVRLLVAENNAYLNMQDSRH